MGLLGLDGVHDAAQSGAPHVLREVLRVGDHVLGGHVQVAVDVLVRREDLLQTRPLDLGVFAGREFEAHLHELVVVVLVGEPAADRLLQVAELHTPGVRGVVWE